MRSYNIFWSLVSYVLPCVMAGAVAPLTPPKTGAMAERNTFQGERCIYNALNNRIRNLLLSYDYSKSTDPLQPWAMHITSLLTMDRPKTSDISLVSDSDSFHLHKFLLSARTPYFRRKLSERPETEVWKLSDSIPAEAFQVVLRYLYLGQLPRDLVDPRSGMSEERLFLGIDKLTKQLEVEKLWEAVLSVNDRRLARQRYQDEVARAQGQVEVFFQDSVLRHKMTVETQKVGEICWPRENAIFADCLLRADAEDGDDDFPRATSVSNGIPIGPGTGPAQQSKYRRPKRSVVYPAHKAFLIRSPYFQTMFSGPFLEAQAAEFLHIIKVDCVPEVLEIILTFLYTEKADCSLDLALDLLYAADMLFIDKLKTKAAATISTLGSGNNKAVVSHRDVGDCSGGPQEVEVEAINVYDVIRAAWDLGVQRLEEFAARYIAYRLEDYIDDPEFADFVKESASRIKDRQETDTIELLDDIRHYLDERFRLRFEEAGLEDLLDEDADVDRPDDQANSQREGNDIGGTRNGEDDAPPVTLSGDTAVTTLEGEVVEDEFDLEAMNYRILLQKIDVLLEDLKLDA